MSIKEYMRDTYFTIIQGECPKCSYTYLYLQDIAYETQLLTCPRCGCPIPEKHIIGE